MLGLVRLVIEQEIFMYCLIISTRVLVNFFF